MSAKVLALAQGDVDNAKERYGGPDVEWVDDWPPVPGKYDMVVLYHLIQQARRDQVNKVLALYRDSLRDGGELVIVVPSLEWACERIAADEHPPAMAYLSIYGDDQVPNLSGMTLLWLRGILNRLGFQVRVATGEWYMATITSEETTAEEKVMQNVVHAVKIAEPQLAGATFVAENPGDAIA